MPLLCIAQIDSFSASDQTRFVWPFLPAIVHLKMCTSNGGHPAGTPSRRQSGYTGRIQTGTKGSWLNVGCRPHQDVNHMASCNSAENEGTLAEAVEIQLFLFLSIAARISPSGPKNRPHKKPFIPSMNKPTKANKIQMIKISMYRFSVLY